MLAVQANSSVWRSAVGQAAKSENFEYGTPNKLQSTRTGGMTSPRYLVDEGGGGFGYFSGYFDGGGVSHCSLPRHNSLGSFPKYGTKYLPCIS